MFKGSLPALVTPFTNGQVDVATLKKLVNWHIEQGSHGLVPVGTTGESPTLTHEEHDMVVEIVVAEAAGRIPVIAGAGSNSTAETVRLVQAAKKAGADAALVVTPYYNKPTQRGLMAHFLAAADCGLPIIIYNIPPRSVIDMTPDTMGELAKHEMIIGVKDATADLSRVPAQRLRCGSDFIQLSGEDATALGYNAHGGMGCISVTANIAPKLIAEFQETTLAGDYASARAQLDRLMPLHEAVFTEPGVVGAKYGMSLLGLCSDEVRSPLTGLMDSTKEKLRAAMVHAGLLN
ncbi:4-hydroxy-tetrahydrodipicolinate synthase [Yoonia sediminilitoris]|uniref:4-hydroxy-tetrahydrodipicolinate synthase n=1 Tax=Yoonia sediminilitoris TaxID=1286148 RepID=A0A2T6KAM1_9RHOB|nr:4-hydroxy-tetrahydrodipicolinate synthase [Yoonia sediminilitoris]PUB11844.1 4-hydroxy-tetrahydrodipicolinate synthase [Yoonia sediminilitoris]RCW91921.1 4-hydroxy-tetrahydrodipicolinate synthase [Yoonia sediminilitoris]